MIKYIMRAASLGAFYTGITGLLAGFGLGVFWEGLSGGLIMLTIVWVPFAGIAGLLIGFFLFLIVGFIVSSSSILKDGSIASFAIMGGVISLLPHLWRELLWAENYNSYCGIRCR